MDFTLDETQQVIARVAAEVLETASPEGAWKALGQAGMLTLAVPVTLGGEGLGPLEVAVLLREVGRHAAMIPALSHLATGVLPAAKWGTPDLFTGDHFLSAALNERSNPMPAWPRTTFERGVLNGEKVGVPYADTAYRILVPVTDGIAVVDPALAKLERTPTSSGTPEFTVTFHDSPVSAFWQADIGELYQLAIVGACAMADGLLAGALDLTTKHIGTREQFGKPLATFQAVAGQIADVYIASRTLHLASLSAAWRLGTGRDAASDVDVAATWLAQEAMTAMRTCHHLHGGIGLDITYPLHRYTSLMKDLVRYVPRPD